jgi:hypothetical protein
MNLPVFVKGAACEKKIHHNGDPASNEEAKTDVDADPIRTRQASLFWETQQAM